MNLIIKLFRIIQDHKLMCRLPSWLGGGHKRRVFDREQQDERHVIRYTVCPRCKGDEKAYKTQPRNGEHP
jgi:hypothetical protein